MGKYNLLFGPFFIGLALITYSWFISYPISLSSANDYNFYHISTIYWIGLGLLLASSYLIAVTFNSNLLKWVMTVCVVLAMYSTSFFFNYLSTSDALFYRGLNEYFLRTENLDSSLPGKGYLQWPAIFLFTNAATLISGLSLTDFEFLMYAVIGIMLTTALYLYAVKRFKNGGFLAVIAFFIAMYYYLNYQFAAFTIAFFFLILAFALEPETWSSGKMLLMLFLFAGMTLSHAYVAVFYIIFLCIKTILKRDKQYRKLFLITLTVYFLYQITLTNNALNSYVQQLTKLDTDVSGISGLSVTPVIIPIDVVAQRVLSVVLVVTLAVCSIGFLLLFIKRKLTPFDKAIFFTGIGYFLFGLAFWVLGPRAIPLAFIPVSLGVAYLFETRFKKYVVAIFLVVLVLTVFMPMHNSFMKGVDFSQTEDASNAAQFMLERYNWSRSGAILAHGPVAEYFFSNLGLIETSKTYIQHDRTMQYPLFERYSSIFYTRGLEQVLSNNFADYNYSVSQFDDANLDIVYDNGISLIFLRRPE